MSSNRLIPLVSKCTSEACSDGNLVLSLKCMDRIRLGRGCAIITFYGCHFCKRVCLVNSGQCVLGKLSYQL